MWAKCFSTKSPRRQFRLHQTWWMVLGFKRSSENTYLIAFFRLVVSIRIWKMDVAACFFHHFFNIIPSFANDMRMLSVRYVHLQGDSIALESKSGYFLFHSPGREYISSLWSCWHSGLGFQSKPIFSGEISSGPFHITFPELEKVRVFLKLKMEIFYTN